MSRGSHTCFAVNENSYGDRRGTDLMHPAWTRPLTVAAARQRAPAWDLAGGGRV